MIVQHTGVTVKLENITNDPLESPDTHGIATADTHKLWDTRLQEILRTAKFKNSQTASHLQELDEHLKIAYEARECYNNDVSDARQACEEFKKDPCGRLRKLVLSFDCSKGLPFGTNLTSEPTRVIWISAFVGRLFGIVNEGDQDLSLYVWSEFEAPQGSEEVVSCLFQLLTELVDKFDPVEIVLWADNSVAR